MDDFHSFAKELNAELRRAKKSRQRGPTYDKFKNRIEKKKLSGFVDVRLEVEYVKNKADDGSEREVRTYVGEVVVDEAKMLLAGRLDGFWMLVTNHKDKEGDVFHNSRRGDIQRSSPRPSARCSDIVFSSPAALPVSAGSRICRHSFSAWSRFPTRRLA